VSDLDLLYRGTNVTKSGLQLWVTVIQVSNTGSADVLMPFYDPKAPLGFSVTNGKLLKAELLSASSDYLRDNLRILPKNPNEIVFNPTILEKDEGFTLKLLLLQAQGVSPQVQAIGKIAGVKDLELEPYQEQHWPGFLVASFGGDPFAQILRLLAYPALAIMLLASVAIPTAFLMERGGFNYSGRVMNDYLEWRGGKANEKEVLLASRYLWRPLPYLEVTAHYVTLPGAIRPDLTWVIRHANPDSDLWPIIRSDLDAAMDKPASFAPPGCAYELVMAGVIREVNGSVRIDHEQLENFKRIIEFKRIQDGRIEGEIEVEGKVKAEPTRRQRVTRSRHKRRRSGKDRS